MKCGCNACRMYGELQSLSGLSNPFIQYLCPTKQSFVLAGKVPSTRKEADQLIADLKRDWEISKKPGPKAAKAESVTYYDIGMALYELMQVIDNPSLSYLASELDVPQRHIQDVLKNAYTTFTKLKAEIAMNRPSRLRFRLKGKRVKH